MKKITSVLTLTALSAALLGHPAVAQTSSAQSLASLTAKSYDTTLASNALAANTDAGALLTAINANRRANGLTQLTLDPSLGAATMYQMTDENKQHFAGQYAYKADGQTQVDPATMAADFGSAAANVQEFSFGNGFFLGDTDNWPALMADWQQNDPSFTAMISSPNVNVCGITLIDAGTQGTTHIYKWAIMVGYNPSAATAQAPSAAQSLASLTAKSYDTTLASNALAANTDAGALLTAINANRRANGLTQLTLDPSLGAATMYQMTDENKQHFAGQYAYKADGQTQVDPATMAADFGSAAANVQEFSFGNGFFLGDTDNWPALMADWQQNDPSFTAMISSPNVNVYGITLIDAGTQGTTHIYKWAIMIGYNPSAATAPTGPTGPTINTTGLNQTLAQQAMAAKPTADETNFLGAINSYRTQAGLPTMVQDAAMYPAAYYQLRDTAGTPISTLATDFGSLHNTFTSSTNNSGTLFYGYLVGYYGQWSTLVSYWRTSDPSFTSILGSAAYSHCGFSILDTGTKQVSPFDGQAYEVYKWTLVAGN